MDTQQNTSLKNIDSDDLEKQQKYYLFKERNKKLLETWLASHPGKNPPIYYDENRKDFRFLSRTERRNVRKAKGG